MLAITLLGEFQVGIIIFDMSLSFEYHDFVSHVTKLQKYIAHDLEVNSNQVSEKKRSEFLLKGQEKYI